MCNFNSYTSPKKIKVGKKPLQAILFDSKLAGFHEFPDWPVIVKDANGQYDNLLMNWTLIPAWVQTFNEAMQMKYSTQNAVIESIFEKRTFKDAAIHRRCLVLSSGFYEWRHMPKIGKKGELLKTSEAYPYFIRIKERDYFFMAGIWQPWDRDGKQLNTFSICTQPANKVMMQIHNKIDTKTGKPKHRMPVILNDDMAEKWVSADLTENEILDFKNYHIPDNELDFYTVDKKFKELPDPQKHIRYNIPEITL